MLILAGTAVHGVSIGGVETCIQLPGYDLCFDIGRCPRSAVHRSRVAFTHAHLDHMGGMAMHTATRALTAQEPPTYLLPAKELAGVQNLLAAWRRLDHSRLACELVPLEPGDRYDLGAGQELVAFATRHSVPSLGYGLFSSKQKLKPAYQGLPGTTLRDLRLAGEPITETVRTCDVATLGDSRIDVLDEQPWLYEARLLILEATFLDERVGVAETRAKGHVHLDEILERADRFLNQALLLTHFSARYSSDEIRAILGERLPPGLGERVQVLLPRG
ncbi:MAG: MBL fold metallo-hydrolase [Pseudomonadota bacterium]